MVGMELTTGFNYNYEETIDYTSFVFKGGEPHIKINSKFYKSTDVDILIRIETFADIGKLMVAVDALKQIGWLGDLSLTLPYFPGARQDRRMVYGEPLTVKIYADIINSMGFVNVKIFDPHSDVAPALIENVNVISNHEFVKEVIQSLDFNGDYNLISPDSGANKKIYKLAESLRINKMYNNNSALIKCDKHRDVATGDILRTEAYTGDLGGFPCIIVDDICDGGKTFIELAKELKRKNPGDLYLIVSHGIFSNEFEELEKYFTGIYTTDSFYDIRDDYKSEILNIHGIKRYM